MYKNSLNITTSLLFILMTLQSCAQSQNPPITGYYVTDSIRHNLENANRFNLSEQSYSYLNMEEKTLVSYKFPKKKIDNLDLEKKTFKDIFFNNKPTLIWNDENRFAIDIKDTIFNKTINVYAELVRVEKDDARILKIKKDIQQRQQKRDLEHVVLKKEFLKPLDTPNGYLDYIPKTEFGLSKPLNVEQSNYIERNFNYQLVNFEKDSLLEKESIIFYATYKHKTNTNSFDGLNLAIIKSGKPFTLHSFVKKIDLEPVTIVFRTEKTLLVKDGWGGYIFFSVKKLSENSYVIGKGISKTFEYAKKQFYLFSSINNIENVNALSTKPLFTELSLTKTDSLFENSVNKALKNETSPQYFIRKSSKGEPIYGVNTYSFNDSYLQLKEASVSSLIKTIKVENKAYHLIHQDKNSLIYKNEERFNVFILKPYKGYTAVLSLNQIKTVFSVEKPLQNATYFYKNAKVVLLNNYPIIKNLKPYFNYFKTVWMVFNEKDNLFIVTKSEDEGIEGVFSINGNYVLPLKYNDISYQSEGSGFYIETFHKQRMKSKPEDSIKYNYIKETNKKRGWASEDGKTIIEPQYHSIGKIAGANLVHVYSHNDEEGILDIITKQYVIPLKQHDIRHYDIEKRFVISEGYGINYLVNYKGEMKGPFERLNYKLKNNRGEFIGTKNGVETKLLFD